MSSALLLAELAASPEDEGVRARAARALAAEGRVAEAADLLTQALRNLTGHEPPIPLPCLCQSCLQPSVETAQADGETYHRAFAVAKGRVLFYWVPASIRLKPGLLESVAASMRARLKG